MMKKVLAIALLAGSMIVAQAATISGNITFKGGAELDTGDIGTATAVTGWSNTAVESRDGDFALNGVTVNQAVTFTAPWSFNSGVNNLWQVGIFTFDLTSSAVAFQNGTFLSVSGTGVLSAAGFDDTYGTWNFSTQNPAAGTPAVFSFSASSSVPDGGSTLALMGGAVLALGVFRRKLSALVG